jgi:HK97 family phage prohead protease
MELKAVNAQYKASNEENTFEGYASVFGNKDSYGDVVMPGAFARTLQDQANRVKVIWQHDPSSPIGIPIEMREDEIGLKVKAKIANTTLGRDAIELIKAGVVTELSIGYDTITKNYDEQTNTRQLTEIRLWEFSPVTWAANDLAKITAVKHISELDLILDKLERIEWAKGKIRSEVMHKRVTQAIQTLTKIRDGDQPPTKTGTDISHAAPSNKTPSPTQATLQSLSALKHQVLAAATLNDLRQFGNTLKEKN